MKSLTLRFDFLDDGNVAIMNGTDVELSGLEDAKMIAAFLTFCNIESNAEVVDYGISLYHGGLAWMDIRIAEPRN